MLRTLVSTKGTVWGGMGTSTLIVLMVATGMSRFLLLRLKGGRDLMGVW